MWWSTVKRIAKEPTAPYRSTSPLPEKCDSGIFYAGSFLNETQPQLLGAVDRLQVLV
jgi:hypothetical protein